MANQGFKFVSWVENLGHNSTKPITLSSNSGSPIDFFLANLGLRSIDNASTLTVTYPGSFTANFKEIPSPIPKEYLIGLYSIVATTIVGLAIPSIVAWIKSKAEIRKLSYYYKKINLLYDDGELDEKDVWELNKLKDSISEAYSKGQINTEHYSSLKDELSILYQEIFKKRIDMSSNEQKVKSMNIIKDDISDAYSTGKINELHYNLLKEKISEDAENKKYDQK